MERTNQCSLSVLEWYMQYGMGQQVPIRSSAVNASKDMFIGKVCRELNDIPSPSGQGCAFPSKVDALMPASRRQYLLLSSVKHRHMKI